MDGDPSGILQLELQCCVYVTFALSPLIDREITAIIVKEKTVYICPETTCLKVYEPSTTRVIRHRQKQQLTIC